jgi:hypothetical protein
MRPKIEEVCRKQGVEPPIICTPQELMEGQIMWKDPIVEETRKLREKYASKFNHDIEIFVKKV